MHVLQASHIEPVQSAGIKLMREVPFDPLSPLPLQPLAAFPLNAPPIGVDRCLLRRFAFPLALATIGLRDIRSNFQLGKAKRHVIAVIALVRHHFLDSVRMH